MKRALLATAMLGALAACSQPSVRGLVEWPAYGGDPGGMKYSPLADINRGNVARLTSAWTWETGEQPIADSDSTKAARPGMFQTTPIMLNDTLYFSTPFNRVVALDPTTGAKYWEFDPGAYRPGQPSNGTGFVHRGVAMWSDGSERRIFINSRWRLIALNAATGQPVSTFGSSGEVDLTSDLSRPVEKRHYTNTSPPVVWHDLVIVGNGVGDRLVYKGDPPGDVQAFDVRTGKRMWRFRTVPEPGDSGNATWEKESWRYVGHTNVWAPFTVDTARGYLYLPVGTPSNDWYGGRRLGANLYGESIVCLDARTGQRVWHYQIAHHGLWDYDLPAPPNLVTISVDGSSIDAVVVPTKQGWVFVFDRQTGRPVWPIEERPVPASDVPGERAWPTQPFPSLPAAVAVQGFGPNDVLDYTPDIKAAALAELNKYVAGPMYSPPSEMGTVTMPGSIGGVGWGGAAFDPETNTLFVKASNSPSLWRLVKQAVKSDTVDDTYMADLRNSSLGVRLSGGPEGTERDSNATPLPLNKPPYGTLTAIDLNTGEHKWQIPIGDTPDVRKNPALAGVRLPSALGVSGAPGGVATKGGLVFITGGGSTLYAIDSNDGHVRWQTDLGQRGYANPMTYRTKAGKQFVLIATGGPGPGANSSLRAPVTRSVLTSLLLFAAPRFAVAQRALQTDADHYTRYELLAPGSAKFRIIYEVTATTAGATRYFNPIRKGSVATDEAVYDRMTGDKLKFEVVSGRVARDGGVTRADTTGEYIMVTLPRAVPKDGEVRLLIEKTYEDPKSYLVSGDTITFDRSLGITKNSVVLPLGYELIAVNYPSQIRREADGRIQVSFINVGSAAVPYVVKGRKVRS